MLRAAFLSLTLILMAAPPTVAQENQRTRYNENRAEFDAMVQARRMGDAMQYLLGEAAVPVEEAGKFNDQVANYYSSDFIGTATVRSEALKDGFRHEMLAYWNEERQYLYVYVVLHTIDNVQRTVSVTYDSDFADIIALF
ncbi:hypothetical protein [Shimia biformata]|uniref:hypothetical protein n=1 Tax=Shimia biformata TaxID=1294299 RepID=UPI00194E6756|nr:hypothetical protein [Shimia biformata]